MRGTPRLCKILFRLDQTVVAILAAVDHTGLVGCIVDEDEELVPQQIHLQDSLLHRHGLEIEALGADTEFGLFLHLFLGILGNKRAAAQPLLQAT